MKSLLPYALLFLVVLLGADAWTTRRQNEIYAKIIREDAVLLHRIASRDSALTPSERQQLLDEAGRQDMMARRPLSPD